MFTWLANRLAGGQRDRPSYQMAEKLYAAIVAQARQTVFYRELEVRDTVPGRFELVTLHMFIVLDRLRNKGELSDEIAQQLVDVMFEDMDDVAREIGIGDMGVGPRIKKLARSFQSRMDYYHEAIHGDGEGQFPRGALPDALVEGIFQNDQARMANALKLADYVSDNQTRIADLSLEEMLTFKPLFGDLKTATNGDHSS